MDDMTRKQRETINKGFSSVVHILDQTDRSMSKILYECLKREAKGRTLINAKALIVVSFTDGIAGIDQPFRQFVGISSGLLVAAGLGARVAMSYPDAVPSNWLAICYGVHEAMWPGRPQAGSVFAAKAIPGKPASQSNYTGE